MKRTLYHGSKSGLVGPIRPVSRSVCDFGPAFYMGESERQPLTLVCHAPAPKLYELELDDEGLVTREIGDGSLWALLVAYHRGAMAKYADAPICRVLASVGEGVDLLRGRIANDRVFETVQMFFDRTITLETLIEVLKAVNLGHQVCALTERACERLRIVSVRELDAKACEQLRMRSENQRRMARDLTTRLIDSRRRTDGVYFDELCERFRSGEGLC